ncbi:DgyrCDS7173 [Dimorphilus gyrociliatus]|uniref:UDP-N-acetylglucosamine diphosphorylase n=1 Tax=Dimorphilus gyrociliatus TaxID=2664684 RepID=A0A7I8VRX6_9ANNE|nr:DgyrCDS7173 [Dimorphilus gyrociliatus]
MEEIRKTAEFYGQAHVFKYWEHLSDDEKDKLKEDLSTIDFAAIGLNFQKCVSQLEKMGQKIDNEIEPPSEDCLFSKALGSSEDVERYTQIEIGKERLSDNRIIFLYVLGYKAISDNRVALLLLAGGQGTRLGVPYPKGMYDIGLPSKKTLYQIQAERIIKVQRNAMKLNNSSQSPVIPWYIMVSKHTKDMTEKFFEEHNYFGLEKDNVSFFVQRLLPCLDFDGKIIMESKFKVAKAPDGNGGLYAALNDANIIEDMEKRGIRHICIHGVDNILVKLADPAFMGYCEDRGASCGSKVVEKKNPEESVGVVCKINNQYGVVEYSEISKETSEKRKPDGRLLYSGANIVYHYLNFEFLKLICRDYVDDLDPHVAKKKIPFVNENGTTVKPEQVNGIKIEKFVFDIFKYATNFVLWEVLKEDEFAPLKNADGASSATPTECRKMMLDLCRRYVLNAGGQFSQDDGSNDSIVCEISPLLSYDGEDLGDIVNNETFYSPLVLYAKEEKEKSFLNKI